MTRVDMGCFLYTKIPKNLFSGVSGPLRLGMFRYAFCNCPRLSGHIPADLFANISGVSGFAFYGTFQNCSKLTGSIPENLFAGVQGAPLVSMFNQTFSGCSGLTGGIPGTLFSGIKGAPVTCLFNATFSGCHRLSGEIPESLFDGIDVNAELNACSFLATFSGCTGLRGESAKIKGRYLYEIWPDATSDQVRNCYYNDKALSDYDDIPSAWR